MCRRLLLAKGVAILTHPSPHMYIYIPFTLKSFATLLLHADGDKFKWLSEMILVNPEIIEKSTKTDIMEEGCLSFPGMHGDVSTGERGIAWRYRLFFLG